MTAGASQISEMLNLAVQFGDAGVSTSERGAVQVALLKKVEEISGLGPEARLAAIRKTHCIADPLTRTMVVGEIIDGGLPPGMAESLDFEILSHLARSPHQEDLFSLSQLAGKFERRISRFVLHQALLHGYRRAKGLARQHLREALGRRRLRLISLAGHAFWAGFWLTLTINNVILHFGSRLGNFALLESRMLFLVLNAPSSWLPDVLPQELQGAAFYLAFFMLNPLFWGLVLYLLGRWFMWNYLVAGRRVR